MFGGSGGDVVRMGWMGLGPIGWIRDTLSGLRVA